MVAPLIKTRWNQDSVGGNYCYNYYTPNHYVCGCVATAGAQIMYYHHAPTKTLASKNFTCFLNGSATTLATKGGTYDWDNMVEVPSGSNLTDEKRQAIGKLTYDVGVACNMQYASGGSGTGGYVLANALKTYFGYANAAPFMIYDSTLGDVVNASPEVLKSVIIPNMDAKLPVLIGINSASEGHAVVVDGYGYDNDDLAIHVNMGWSGSYDAWYIPPNIERFTAITTFVANIYPTGAANGVICSGKVLNAKTGEPMVGVTVSAAALNKFTGNMNDARYVCQTDENGIYALILGTGKSRKIIAEHNGVAVTNTVTVVKNTETMLAMDYSPPLFYDNDIAVNNLYDQNLLLTVAEPTEEYTTTEVPVPYSWIREYYPGTTDFDAVAKAKTGKKGANGTELCVWHDYVIGTNPAKLDDVFKAYIEVVNDKAVITWEPDLKDERVYRIWGKTTLENAVNWTELKGSTAGYHFFKVSVEMP